ncbi:LXG domain-containing protein, partial [Lysinibacillus sp. 54212]|uniref:LXG domain-containing protein n=1 Tax=Lysinibacillus sp. 54212 TaxID=3119829 RepID=UPI002FCB7E45
MKVLDVDAFEIGMDETYKKITTLSSQMKQVERSMDQLIGLSDAFKGEGPQAILTFYEQYHKPLLKTYHTFTGDYQLTIENMRKALLDLEPARDGLIRQSFLEGELHQGILHAKNTTIALTGEANDIMQTVSDIVALPPLREDGVVRAC